MRILVTGGAGYIGSHTVRQLARRGHEVAILDNLSTGHALLAGGFELIEADVGDRARLAAALGGVQAVVHFAARASAPESVSAPRRYYENNVAGALALLGAVLDAGIRYFIHSSSCAVYGVPARIPITEDAPRQPVNPYGDTKLAVENMLHGCGAAYGLRCANLRYFNAAGADESSEIGELHQPEFHLIPSALEVAAGRRQALEIYGADYPTPDGTCVRDYVHVNDLALAHALVLEFLQAQDSGGGGGVVTDLNLGAGQGHSVLEILSMVEQITGRPVPARRAPRRPGDPPMLVADNARAGKLLGWRPSRGLREMVESAWKWMNSERCSRIRLPRAEPLC